MYMYVSSLDSKPVIWNSLVPEKNFAADADFRAEKSPEGLRRKQNDRRCPVKLGPRILKNVVFHDIVTLRAPDGTCLAPWLICSKVFN